jgi:hypothetical protein
MDNTSYRKTAPDVCIMENQHKAPSKNRNKEEKTRVVLKSLQFRRLQMFSLN